MNSEEQTYTILVTYAERSPAQREQAKRERTLDPVYAITDIHNGGYIAFSELSMRKVGEREREIPVYFMEYDEAISFGRRVFTTGDLTSNDLTPGKLRVLAWRVTPIPVEKVN